MLPYSREVYFSLFGELNTRYQGLPQGIALLLALLLAWLLVRPAACQRRFALVLLAVLWSGSAYFWFSEILAGVHFLAPVYAAMAAAQAVALGIAAALPSSTKSLEAGRIRCLPLVVPALAWPLLDLFSGTGWPMVRGVGLHALPLLLLTQGALLRPPLRAALGLALMPFLLAGVCAYDAYVLDLHQDWIPLIGCAYFIAILLRRKTGT